MWHEGLAGRGSAEVGSCLWNYLKENANGKPFVLMSDTCSGQNRNIFVTALLLHAVRELDIPRIDQCFFEPGHSMMECDSVHSRIETVTKNLEIFDPAGWYGAVKQASRKGKYSVIEVGEQEFYNIDDLRSKIIINPYPGQIQLMKTTCLRFMKSDLDTIYYNHNYNEDLKKFNVKERKRARRGHLPGDQEHITLKTAPHSNKAIFPKKAADLLELCKSEIISLTYYPFYERICGVVKEEEGNTTPLHMSELE